MASFKAEPIPNADQLYMRVHIGTWARGGNLRAGAFQNHNGGMSTDWSKYSTAEQTRERGRKPAAEYAVVEMSAGAVRAVPGQEVRHAPLPDNRAHTDVVGEKDEEARTLLKRLSHWTIPPSQSS